MVLSIVGNRVITRNQSKTAFCPTKPNPKVIVSYLDIVFEGIRCPIHVDTLHKSNEKVSIRHKKGFMILHDGKNRHYVNSIEAGERYNLIIWCQSRDENLEWFNALQNYECMDFCNY